MISRETYDRKLRKLRRDPIQFFADAKSPAIRRLGPVWLTVTILLADWHRFPLILLDRIYGVFRPSRFRLEAVRQLHHDGLQWRSTGSDPGFAIRIHPRLLCGGWALVSFQVRGAEPSLEPVLHIDDVDGAFDGTRIRLPPVVEGLICRLVRLPTRNFTLSLKPLSGPGRFKIENFRVTPITAFGALRVMRRHGHELAPALREVRRSTSGPNERFFPPVSVAGDDASDLRLLRNSAMFDPDYYVARYDDVAETGLDPAEHYYRFGAQEGRNPSRFFDTKFYLNSSPDVALAGANPLMHFLRRGKALGVKPAPYHGPITPKPVAPRATQWQSLIEIGRNRTGFAPTIDIVVPVYRGYDDTLACLYSVLASECQTPYELIVIDDDSPEPALSAALDELAEAGLITLFRNERNLGFPRTANRGMLLHDDRDVVLLNADTIVYGTWLDRLCRHVALNPCAATVTPLSNNATVCSYPLTDTDNNSLLELPFERLDALAAKVNRDCAVQAPTGVGFCMYVQRGCIQDIGPFDTERYDFGYGEENDFCQHALQQGWLNLIACDVFVRHTGEVSFASSSKKAKRKALRKLSTKYPGYQDDIAKFVAADPLAQYRRALDRARLARAAGGTRPVLFITHERGGGVERYINEEAARLRDHGHGVLVLRSAHGQSGLASINTFDELYLPNLNPVDINGPLDDLILLLRDLKVSSVQIHSLADYPESMPDIVSTIVRHLGVPYQFMVHDYLAICPRTNLIDGSGSYCGESGEDACRQCLSANGSPFGMADIVQWRQRYRALLGGAAALQTPSNDTALRMRAYFRDMDFTVRPHEENLNPPHGYAPPARQRGSSLRVAVIGAIGPHKGSRILLQCSRDAIERKLPLDFCIIGSTDLAELETMSNVSVTGPYAEAEVFDLIRRSRTHVAFFPSVWPETYSYTLSIAFAAGFPTVVFDIGAPAERVRQSARGLVLRLGLLNKPDKINDFLLQADSVESVTEMHGD